ncbi:hypothetical protein Bandiella_00062 [Candidatus Bandiella woodruffii]|uniref:Uncharacterized protein n=1 Tax=Candidatus Bandiella euplotis TaxID=1664265 RepID=A0ABZ0UIQ5_9RICK|nr:hypothetical protein Bandiella_00062 [Candidatus Bandiella woodruffii]
MRISFAYRANQKKAHEPNKIGIHTSGKYDDANFLS